MQQQRIEPMAKPSSLEPVRSPGVEARSGRVAPPVAPRRARRGVAALSILAVLLVFAWLFAVGLWPRLQSGKATAAVAKDTRPTVTTVTAKKDKAEADLILPGSTLAIQETLIYARTNGYVKRWYADIGAKVKGGQLLAEIETPELDRELKQALANLQVAKANMVLARTSAERWRSVLKENAVSPQEVDERAGAYEARKADVAAATANVQRLEELKSFERVVAPFAGTITARNIDVGQLISAGNTDPTRLMFKLAKTDILRIYVNVPQTHIRLIQVGQPVTLILREFPDRTFTGKVLRTAGALDAQSKTLLTEVQVPNENGELFAGMYAQVKFALKQPAPAILLPSNTLIVRGADGPQVAAVENDKIHMRKVGLGRDYGTQIEILSGLKEGEAIVTNPNDSIREGTAVKILVAQAEQAPPAAAPATVKPADKNAQSDKPADKK